MAKVLTLCSLQGQEDERGFTEKEDRLIRQAMPGNHMLLEFRGLKSMTIVDVDGQSDLNIAEVDEKPGEYQAWSLGPKGQAEELKTPQSPYSDDDLDLEAITAWNELELLACISPDAPKYLVRGVTLDRLAHMPEWEPRSNQLRHTFHVKNHKGLYPRTVGKGIYFFLNQLKKSHPATYYYLFKEMKKTVPALPRTFPDWNFIGWHPNLLLLAKYGLGYDDGRGVNCYCEYSHPPGCYFERARVRVRHCYESGGITGLMEQMADHLIRVTTTLEGQRTLADIMAYSASDGQTRIKMSQAIAASLASMISEGRVHVPRITLEISHL
jgi:hypothetical protein